jgi:TRAP-type C4-dicarboxylate transport system permease small subunit
MRMGKFFVRTALTIETFIRYVAVGGSVALVIAVLAVSADIFGRLIRVPVIGVEELNTLLIIACVYLGIAFTQTRKKHVTVTVFTDRLPKMPRLILNNILLFISLGFLVLFCYKSLSEAYRSYLIDEYVHGTVQFIIWPAKFIITFGLALISLQIIIDITRGIAEIISTNRRKRGN